MSWPTVPLGELISPAKVRKAGADEYPLLSMTMHNGLVLQSERFDKRIASRDTSTYKVIERGQLVVGFPIDEGVLDFQEVCDEGIVSPAYQVWDIQEPDAVDPNYLGKYLKSPQALSYYMSRLQGSTARRRSLPQSIFLDMGIPLPPVGEQRRIAAMLDRLIEVRVALQESLERFDKLTQAIFAKNIGRDQFPRHGLESVCIGKGQYGASVASQEPSESLPRYVRVTDIKNDGSLQSEARAPRGEEVEWSKFFLAEGDLLFARSGATVGKTYLYQAIDGRCVFAGYLIRFRPDPDLALPEFVYQYTKTVEYSRWVSSQQRSSAQPNINAAQYGERLLIPVPPLAVQREVVRASTAVSKQRDTVTRRLETLDELESTLYARAFRGEL